MYGTALMEARVQELRNEGRLASSGAGMPRRPSRVLAGFRRLRSRSR